MGLPRPQNQENILAGVTALVDALDRGGGPWREVGAAGEPAFGGTWVNFGGAEETAAFYKDALGVVRLKGAVKSGTIGTAAFTLPIGYRPAATLKFVCDANAAFGELVISSAGVVTPNVGSTLHFSLNGVSFRPVPN